MIEMRDIRFAGHLALAAALILGETAFASPPVGLSVGLGGRQFQQVAVTTTNLGRAISFYRDSLGLPMLFVANNMAFFDVAGTRLMVALDPARAEAASTSILYFDAPHFDVQLARLKGLRATLVGGVEVVDRRDGRQLMLQQFTDPDGNALAIMGWAPRR